MKLIRIIPSLLVKNNFLVKGENFSNHQYVGDVYNAVKIFSDKGAHEIILLDIEATNKNKSFNIDLIKKIKNEIFIPLTVGGGIRDVDQVTKVINEGVEKVCLNSVLNAGYSILSKIANKFGSQSLVVSLDVKKTNDEYSIFFNNGTVKSKYVLKEYLKVLQNEGVGEILLTSIDNEGLRKGFDLNLYKEVDNQVSIPIIANGGAQGEQSFQKIFDETNISSASGGSCFVYYGERKAVLINYPSNKVINNLMERYE